MKTEVLKIDPQAIDLEKIRRAAQVIKNGGIVAFPTETVYGLAADFCNKQAVEKIYRVKKRLEKKPLTVQIDDVSSLDTLVSDIPPFAYQLISKFWPGPLTLILPAKREGSGIFKKGERTIGVRIPDNPIAQQLIKESATPVVAPSANLSGEPPAKCAREVLDVFDGLIEMVIDGGKAESGLASTVVDLTASRLKILRVGVITEKDIQSVQG